MKRTCYPFPMPCQYQNQANRARKSAPKWRHHPSHQHQQQPLRSNHQHQLPHQIRCNLEIFPISSLIMMIRMMAGHSKNRRMICQLKGIIGFLSRLLSRDSFKDYFHLIEKYKGLNRTLWTDQKHFDWPKQIWTNQIAKFKIWTVWAYLKVFKVVISMLL